MSIHFSQGKLQGQERITIIQEVQKQAKAAALLAIKPIITAFWRLSSTPNWDGKRGTKTGEQPAA